MMYGWIILVTLAAQSFELTLDEGIRRYWNGEYEATIDVLQNACAMNASSGEKLECHKYLAFSHVALGADDEAESEFIALLSTDAGYRLDESLVSPKIVSRFESARAELASNVYNDAKDAYQAEQFDDAVALFDRTVELDPTHELAREYAALCRERIKLAEATPLPPSTLTPSAQAAGRTAPAAVAPAAATAKPAAEVDNDVHWLTSEINRPVLVKRVSPPYPQTARLRRAEGSVVISAVIDKNGLITQPKVIRSVSEQLDRAALDAVRQWEYQPATLNGSPVAVYGIIELSFTLDGS